VAELDTLVICLQFAKRLDVTTASAGKDEKFIFDVIFRTRKNIGSAKIMICKSIMIIIIIKVKGKVVPVLN
jgi:hypothetical protein